MTIKLNPKMKMAILVGLQELDNSGLWEMDLSEEEIDDVEKGKEELRSLLR
jgi:hypothetical protein